MYKVVITDSGYRHYNIERELVESIGGELIVRGCETEDDVIDLARDADGVIARLQPITRRVIESLEKCRVIARYGTGVDNVDLAAATERGIVVANVVDFGNDEVAENAIALLLGCVRKTASHDRMIRNRTWDVGQRDPIFRMKGKTLGLLGFGKIARAVARKMSGFDLRVIAFNPYCDAETARSSNADLVDLETLLRESDYVSIHAPLTPETRHIINAETLALMKSTAILVNTARGGLLDTKALYYALKDGEINSAGLDVHESEPVPLDYCMFELDNVVISDHSGWYSEDSIANLQRGAVEAIVAVLSGRQPKWIVNPHLKMPFL